MATVCAGTLAMMDGGIQIKAPVAGIAMGLVTDKDSGNYAVLSDILGDETTLATWTSRSLVPKGITACQMDIKISRSELRNSGEALMQARAGRLHILDKMLETLDAPRTDYKPHAPRMEVMRIPKFIGAIIGPGGKVIQGIQADTGASISIEEEGEEGIVEISSNDGEAMASAIKAIKEIIFIPEVGQVYHGTVKNIMPFGAFVEMQKERMDCCTFRRSNGADWKRSKMC